MPQQKKTINQAAAWLAVAVVFSYSTGSCKPDDSPFRAENDALKKQVSKQESLLSSLQDGNKVMQQQIDLLNQELRDVKKATEFVKGETKQLSEQFEV